MPLVSGPNERISKVRLSHAVSQKSNRALKDRGLSETEQEDNSRKKKRRIIILILLLLLLLSIGSCAM